MNTLILPPLIVAVVVVTLLYAYAVFEHVRYTRRAIIGAIEDHALPFEVPLLHQHLNAVSFWTHYRVEFKGRDPLTLYSQRIQTLCRRAAVTS